MLKYKMIDVYVILATETGEFPFWQVMSLVCALKRLTRNQEVAGSIPGKNKEIFALGWGP